MIASNLLNTINRFVPRPSHPFNLNNDGIATYSQWQYQKGEDTIRNYLNAATKEEMFKDKVVIDLGCGAAGKSLYYATLGAEMVYGVEILQKYEAPAKELAETLGLSDKFTFVHADGANLPFESNTIDSIIINDAMEHVDEPEAVLKECLRVLKPKGRIYVNFPPYFHPHGAHLSDAIGIPWVHMFFSEKTLINSYKSLVKPLPDGKERLAFRISTNDAGEEYFSYINKMTVSRFKRILKNENLKAIYYNEIPLRGFFTPLAKTPVLKEMFIKMVVCVIEK